MSDVKSKRSFIGWVCALCAIPLIYVLWMFISLFFSREFGILLFLLFFIAFIFALTFFLKWLDRKVKDKQFYISAGILGLLIILCCFNTSFYGVFERNRTLVFLFLFVFSIVLLFLWVIKKIRLRWFWFLCYLFVILSVIGLIKDSYIEDTYVINGTDTTVGGENK